VIDGGAPPVLPPPKAPAYTGPDAATRRLVLERDGWACVCGVSIIGRAYSLQHRRARSAGGTADPMISSPVNLLVLCGSATTPGSCHLACEERSEEMHERGYWLRSGEDPALVPVLLHGQITAWLTADGRYSTEAPGTAAGEMRAAASDRPSLAQLLLDALGDAIGSRTCSLLFSRSDPADKAADEAAVMRYGEVQAVIRAARSDEEAVAIMADLASKWADTEIAANRSAS
jgi:hypothetical protein